MEASVEELKTSTDAVKEAATEVIIETGETAKKTGKVAFKIIVNWFFTAAITGLIMFIIANVLMRTLSMSASMIKGISFAAWVLILLAISLLYKQRDKVINEIVSEFGKIFKKKK